MLCFNLVLYLGFSIIVSDDLLFNFFFLMDYAVSFYRFSDLCSAGVSFCKQVILHSWLSLRSIQRRMTLGV